MRRLSIDQFHSELKSQGVADVSDLAFVCPMCLTVQSARDLIAAGAGIDFASVERFVGFSCVGRWLGFGPPRVAPDGKPCNWTLGGLFQTHTLEIMDDAGVPHPRFEPASPEQAKAHADWFASAVGASPEE